MTDKKILITGATGATGSAAIDLLLERGETLRAMVRKEDARAAALRKKGVEVVLGDLLDFDSVRASLKGIYSAYFVLPIVPGIIDATAYFAQAAKEAGVHAIVNMSQISARSEAKSHAAQNHWVAEQVFDWSGVPVTHLRPTLFAEWVLYFADFIKAGSLQLPMKDGVHAPIAAEDQARVIAAILAAPEAHAGKVYPLYGAEEMSFPQMADRLGRLLGKPVAYQHTDTDALRKIMGDSLGEGGDYIWQHLHEIAIDHQNGVFAGTNDVVEKIGGRKPMTLAEFVEKHRARLTA